MSNEETARNRLYGRSESEHVAHLHRQMRVRFAVNKVIAPLLPPLTVVRHDWLGLRQVLNELRRKVYV